MSDTHVLDLSEIRKAARVAHEVREMESRMGIRLPFISGEIRGFTGRYFLHRPPGQEDVVMKVAIGDVLVDVADNATGSIR